MIKGERPKFTERLAHYKSLTDTQLILEALLIIMNHENWDKEVKAVRKALQHRKKLIDEMEL